MGIVAKVIVTGILVIVVTIIAIENSLDCLRNVLRR